MFRGQFRLLPKIQMYFQQFMNFSFRVMKLHLDFSIQTFAIISDLSSPLSKNNWNFKSNRKFNKGHTIHGLILYLLEKVLLLRNAFFLCWKRLQYIRVSSDLTWSILQVSDIILRFLSTSFFDKNDGLFLTGFTASLLSLPKQTHCKKPLFGSWFGWALWTT